MRAFFWLISIFLNLFSLLVFIRIVLSWFRNIPLGRPVQILAAITDPYLNWWRRRVRVRFGVLDFSVIIAIVFLSFLQTICTRIALHGSVSLGFILVICIDAIWMAISFIIGFCFLVLVLRLIAYFLNSNMYSPFWQVIDSFSRPILYRINRICFGKRIVRYTTSLITAIILLAVLRIGGHYAIQYLTRYLAIL
ncbi:MAG: YggT family protein [Treponema sp.]|nr:YggT family protein [Treponema sp.]